MSEYSLIHPAVKRKALETVTEEWSFRVPAREFFLISAPMTGIENFNRPLLRRVTVCCGRTGINAYNPFAYTVNDLSKKDSSYFTSRYIPLVTHERCSGVIVLPGWQASDGATTEVLLAGRFDKPLLRYVEADNHATLEFYEREALTL